MILDTNALAAFLEGDPDLFVCLKPVQELYLPVVVSGEYRFGLLKSRQRTALEARLDAIEKVFRILILDGETARFYAQVRAQLRQAGTPIPENDVWIAALARQHKLVIVTRDRHFEAVAGITCICW